MSNCRERSIGLAVALSLLAAPVVLAQAAYPGIGRPATPAEVSAWDIDVRPDFKGLPRGAGTVAKGAEVWESKCASCHGTFGESNQFFSPIVGGTIAQDIGSGRAARLTDPSFPGRTTLMKLPTLSTLWDYINRAMPWTAPKSLSVEEVYAVTAYILNLAGVLPDEFTLSDANIPAVQQKLPNRNGMTTDHALWPDGKAGRRGPDVRAVACMAGCSTDPRIASSIPAYARDAHGNLAEQNRLVGAQRGQHTLREAAGRGAPPPAQAALALAQQLACVACHGLDAQLVGPSFRDVAQRYGGRADGASYLAARIRSGGSGQWGAVPMPPQSLTDDQARVIAAWLAAGAIK